MDYEHFVNAEVRQRSRKIDESKNINLFGIWLAIHSFESIINIFLAIIFMSSLFKIMIVQAANIKGIILFRILIIAIIVLSVYISMKIAKKLSKLGEDMSNNMIYVN